ncbi:MAG TPA: hypothetical protein VFZ20_24970, partial [Longimicrobium sp.]
RVNAPRLPAPPPPDPAAPRSPLARGARKALHVVVRSRTYRDAYLRPNAEYFAGMRLALRGHETLPAAERAALAALARLRQGVRAAQIVGRVLRANLRGG